MSKLTIEDVPQSVITKVEKFLGKTGKAFFTDIYTNYGTLIAVIPESDIGFDGTPHLVHSNEGKQVRNFLRSLDECLQWSDQDLSDIWAEIVLQAIGAKEDIPC